MKLNGYDPYNFINRKYNVQLYSHSGPSGKATRYCSQRAVSRVLTGDGSDNLRSTVKRRLDAGGGFIGRVWVQNSEISSIVRPRLA